MRAKQTNNATAFLSPLCMCRREQRSGKVLVDMFFRFLLPLYYKMIMKGEGVLINFWRKEKDKRCCGVAATRIENMTNKIVRRSKLPAGVGRRHRLVAHAWIDVCKSESRSP